MAVEVKSHVCSCGDCAVAPYDDRCKYEKVVAAAQAFIDFADRDSHNALVDALEAVR